MATVTKPIALDESFNTTEVTPRNIADVLAEGLSHITGRTASEVEYDNTDSGLTADNVQDALDEIVEDIPTVPSVDVQTAVDEFETYNGGLLSSLKVSLTPNQDLHGYDEPWVGGAGKNKLPNNYTGTGTAGVTAVNNSDGSIKLNGTASTTGYILLNRYEVDAFKDVPLKISINGVNGLYLYVNGIDANNRFVKAVGATTSETTITPTYSNYVKIEVGLQLYNGTTFNGTYYPMVRLASESDSTWQPYSNICPISGHTEVDVDVSDGQTTQEQVTVNLGGTYYSGMLDIVSGIFVPDTAGVDFGTLTWTKYDVSQGTLFRAIISDIKKVASQYVVPNMICSQYFTLAQINRVNGSITQVANSASVDVIDNRYSDATSFTSAMSGVMLVYEIATPTSIQLSPTMVKALVGENHLSAPLDGQEITESKYKQAFTFDDVIAYIQSLS